MVIYFYIHIKERKFIWFWVQLHPCMFCSELAKITNFLIFGERIFFPKEKCPNMDPLLFSFDSSSQQCSYRGCKALGLRGSLPIACNRPFRAILGGRAKRRCMRQRAVALWLKITGLTGWTKTRKTQIKILVYPIPSGIIWRRLTVWASISMGCSSCNVQDWVFYFILLYLDADHTSAKKWNKCVEGNQRHFKNLMVQKCLH